MKKYKVTHAADSNDSDCCVGLKVESLHVNSLILAAKSPFFYKLIKNGMVESQRKDATLRITYSEKAALMDLLHFAYNNTLSANTISDLLDVLIVADKFEVTSCMRYCVQLLLKLSMSLESALSYLELPPTVLLAEVVQPLIDASKQYLVAHYKDFDVLRKETMELPLSAIEFVLGSDGLQVDSEDDVYEFILKWGREHYSDVEERREILTKRLSQFIRFSYMSCKKLKEVLVCADFDHQDVNKLIMEALFFKIEVPYGQHFHASKDLKTTKSTFQGRPYNRRLLKLVQLDSPCPSCVVYFDLKQEDCGTLPSINGIHTESILLGGHWLHFCAECEGRPRLSHKFILSLQKNYENSETCVVDFEVAVRRKPSKKFESQCKGIDCVVSLHGYEDLLEIPWSTFIGEDSEYFIEGILHFRVELTIIDSEA